jgi:hypothetical protein
VANTGLSENGVPVTRFGHATRHVRLAVAAVGGDVDRIYRGVLSFGTAVAAFDATTSVTASTARRRAEQHGHSQQHAACENTIRLHGDSLAKEQLRKTLEV